MRSSCGLGHFAEVAEAANDGLEVGDLHAEGLRALAEDFVEFIGWQLAGADEIFDGELEREERIFQLMGEAAGEFAPGGYALGLDETLALADEFGPSCD